MREFSFGLDEEDDSDTGVPSASNVAPDHASDSDSGSSHSSAQDMPVKLKSKRNGLDHFVPRMERPSKVFHQGFFYRLSAFKDNVYYYNCHQVSCNARLKVNFDSGDRTVIVGHSHGRNAGATPSCPGWLEYKSL